MFQNKQIIRASFIGLFIAILASILFYRYFTINNIILDSIIKDNNKIVSYYINNIWDNYDNKTNSLKFTNIEDAIQSKNFRDFTSSSINYLRTLPKAKISILNNEGDEYLTTNPDQIIVDAPSDILGQILLKLDYFFLKSSRYQTSIASMLNGQTSHNFIINARMESSQGQTKPQVFVESFFPISNPTIDQFAIGGGVRIVTNITPEWEKINYFGRRISAFLLGVFLVFFAIIIFNTHHAQKVIDQQVANNKFLEEAKTRAESESSAKTQFLANVSHELRTPLNAIIGFSEMILTEAYGKLEHKQYLEYIHDINNSGKHLLSVINDILDFSQAAAEKLKVDVIEVDATKLASSSLRFVKPRADDAKVQLIEKLPPEHIVIKADPKRLKQALLNLLSNSVKFTPENGSVTLELIQNIQDKIVSIKVVDTGIGMEEKDIPKALSSFGQIDNKLSRKYEGTGLGLPLTKKLVELMGGKFEITTKLGVGTTVTITFKQEEL